MLIPKTLTRTSTAAVALTALGLAAVAGVAVSPAQAASFGSPFRIDVGGGGVTTADGAVWASDRYVTGGTKVGYAGSVSGTPDARLYATARSGLTAVTVPGLPAGKYTVTLLFAETSVHAAGQRVQQVVSEGQTKRNALDVYATAGFAKAWSTSFTSTVKDGTLDLRFVPVKGATQLSGLVVTPSGTVTTTTTSTSTTTTSTTTTSTTSPTGTGTAAFPSQVLDLRNWKLTLPVDSGHAGSPDEYPPNELANAAFAPFFALDPTRTGVVFSANAGGATTSGSGYPRSELRELTNGGTALANWSTTGGTHTMTITQAVTRLTPVKPHLVVGQIHDANDDVMVIRLEGRHLFVDHNGVAGATLSNDYTLGTRFTVRIVAGGGHVRTYYNGAATPADDYAVSASGCYFKAGAYVQTNVSKGEAADASAANTVYALAVTHTA